MLYFVQVLSWCNEVMLFRSMLGAVEILSRYVRDWCSFDGGRIVSCYLFSSKASDWKMFKISELLLYCVILKMLELQVSSIVLRMLSGDRPFLCSFSNCSVGIGALEGSWAAHGPRVKLLSKRVPGTWARSAPLRMQPRIHCCPTLRLVQLYCNAGHKSHGAQNNLPEVPFIQLNSEIW